MHRSKTSTEGTDRKVIETHVRPLKIREEFPFTSSLQGLCIAPNIVANQTFLLKYLSGFPTSLTLNDFRSEIVCVSFFLRLRLSQFYLPWRSVFPRSFVNEETRQEYFVGVSSIQTKRRTEANLYIFLKFHEIPFSQNSRENPLSPKPSWPRV